MAVTDAVNGWGSGTAGVDPGDGAAPDARTATGGPAPVPLVPAARELGLRREEFEIAVHLGLIELTTDRGGGTSGVAPREMERLRGLPGSPGGLRARVRPVGAGEGAGLLGIGPARFTRLARAGCFTPVTLHLNRFGVVVWRYLADDLEAFAARTPQLLVGAESAGPGATHAARTDRRPRNWRCRRVDRMLRRTTDAWSRAAVLATALDRVQLAEVVDDPYERVRLLRLRPGPLLGGVPAAVRKVAERLSIADDPDEVSWRRTQLTAELKRAREERDMPGPGRTPGRPPAPASVHRRVPSRTCRESGGHPRNRALRANFDAGATGPIARHVVSAVYARTADARGGTTAAGDE